MISKTTKEKTKYHWSEIEQMRYIKCLDSRRKLFDLTAPEKNKIGVHKIMSRYVKVRNSAQCRSHHQKMIKKYGSIEAIILQHS
jgi:hypothetical protein